MKCINCLHCKLSTGKKGIAIKKYYLGFKCSKNQLSMRNRAYVLTQLSAERENKECFFYDPIEEDEKWIKQFKKNLPSGLILHKHKKDCVLI